MNSKEFDRGYESAKDSIAKGDDSVEELLADANNSLTDDDFDKGWKKACKENIK